MVGRRYEEGKGVLKSRWGGGKELMGYGGEEVSGGDGGGGGFKEQMGYGGEEVSGGEGGVKEQMGYGGEEV